MPIVRTACLLALGLLASSAGARDLSVVVLPHNPPVRIPYDGGSFDYTVEVTNNDTASIDLDVWTMYTLPGGGAAGPVYGPVVMRLPGGWTACSDMLSQFVAESMPAGAYLYRACVGAYPDSVWAGDSFEFEKAGLLAGWFPQASGTDRFLTAVCFPDPDTGWAVGVVRTILHTTDGGDNWYPQSAPNFTQFADVYFIDTQNGWAIGDLGIIQRTTDGGDTWFQQEAGLSQASYLNGLHFVDEYNGWIVGGKPWTTTQPYRFIIHTTDGGYNWTSQHYQSNVYPLSNVCFSDAQHGYAVGSGSVVLQTTNGGADWSEHPVGTYTLNDVFFVDDSTGWAAGDGGAMVKTTDFGANWVVQYPGTTDDLMSVVFVHPDTGWTAGGTGDHATILHTTDGGSSWVAQDPAAEYGLYDIYFTDGELGWAVGPYGEIVHTTTGGGSQVGVEAPPRNRGTKAGPGLRVRSPNPLTRDATLEYFLPRAGHVRLVLYDAAGRRARLLFDGQSPSGPHAADFDASGLPAGAYLAKLESGGEVATERLVLVK